MTDILNRILETKRAEVAARKATTSLSHLDASIARQSPPRGFRAALDRRAATGYALVAEIKKASPSKGVIREDFDPPRACPRLSVGRRDLPVGTDRRSVVPGRRRLSGCGARCLRPAGAAKGFHGRPVASPRIAQHRRGCGPADHGGARRRAACRDRGERARIRDGRADRSPFARRDGARAEAEVAADRRQQSRLAGFHGRFRAGRTNWCRKRRRIAPSSPRAGLRLAPISTRWPITASGVS